MKAKESLLSNKHNTRMKQMSARSLLGWRLSLPLVTLFDVPILSGLLAFAVYSLFASLYHPIWSSTEVAYYNYLADAFLHGQLHLRVIPPSVHDLSLYQGKYFLYWSPMPAVLMMPLIAAFGVRFSDIFFTIIIASVNVGLVSLLLRYLCVSGIARINRVRRSILVICFAFGTVHMTLAPFGRVWHTGQLVGFLFVLLTYIVAIREKGALAFLLAGLAIAAALLTRNHLAFAGLWPAVYLLYRHRTAGWMRQLQYSLVGIAPVMSAVVLLALYNLFRFGSISDNGLDYHRMAPLFVDDYQKYGAFHVHYLLTNLYYQYINYPLLLRSDTFFGGSLFLLTPLFTAFFVGIKNMRPRWSMLALLGSILLVAAPILLLMGTGWIQFGPRYTLDFTVPLLIFTAIGVRRWPVRLIYILTALAVAHYVIGAMLISNIV